jgi:hypothetical protein
VRADEDALVCDFAEYYHIYDWRSIPLRLAATLCAGLSNKSRTKIRLSGMACDFETYLLACLYDKVSVLIWLQTDDGAKGRNRPKPISDIVAGTKQREKEVVGFASGKDFDKAWKELTEGK